MMNIKPAKPFLKWAGGKTQIIPHINDALPTQLKNKNFTYIEPFVGSGAVLFWMLDTFPNLKKAVINDINFDLINTYKTISSNPRELISILEILQIDFHSLEGNEEKKKEYYYKKRELYNKRILEQSSQAALFIFLNRTCFNGLYRVNRRNEYNVPMGGYNKPIICDQENILSVHKSLQKVEILCGDFEQTLEFAQNNTFFYFDPPYKPLSATSNFNSYTNGEFDDSEQIRLKNFCSNLDSLNHIWVLSNSDIKAQNPDNCFFDNLYSEYSIRRVEARRSINSNPNKRGQIKELLVTNSVKFEKLIIS